MQPLQAYRLAYHRLVAGGVRRTSALLYPLRRRLRRPENRIMLTTGDSLVSPVDEPLLALFERSGSVGVPACRLDVGARDRSTP